MFGSLRSAPALLVGTILVPLLVVGCAGPEAMYTADQKNIAEGYLPRMRAVPHHPDSLRDVTLVEKDNQIELQLSSSYEQMLRNWSSTWQQVQGRTPTGSRSYRSFATLWSRDLSVASLEAEAGISSLTKEVALRHLREREAQHDSTLQIDVYRYQSSPAGRGDLSETRLGVPGRRIQLRDDAGNRYRPLRVESTPVREVFFNSGTVLVRRNTVFFDRVVEGKDILNNVETLRLWVQESFGDDYYFSWSFERVTPQPVSLNERSHHASQSF